MRVSDVPCENLTSLCVEVYADFSFVETLARIVIWRTCMNCTNAGTVYNFDTIDVDGKPEVRLSA